MRANARTHSVAQKQQQLPADAPHSHGIPGFRVACLRAACRAHAHREAAVLLRRRFVRKPLDHTAYALELAVCKGRVFIPARRKQLRYRADHIRRAAQLCACQRQRALRFAARTPHGIPRKALHIAPRQQRERKRAKPRFQQRGCGQCKSGGRCRPCSQEPARNHPFSAALEHRGDQHRKRERPCARDVHAAQHAGRTEQHCSRYPLRAPRAHGTEGRKRCERCAEKKAHLRAEGAAHGQHKVQIGERRRAKRRKEQQRRLIRAAQEAAFHKRPQRHTAARHNRRSKAGEHQLRYADEAVFCAAAMEERQQRQVRCAEQRKLFRRAQPPAPDGNEQPAPHVERGSRKRRVIS